MLKQRTYGGELEKPVSNRKTDMPYGVSQDFFNRLAAQSKKRGYKPHFHMSDVNPSTILGVQSSDLGEQGLDNATNLQETAIPYVHNLGDFASLAKLDLEIVQQVLEKEKASIINMSNHPLGQTDMDTYHTFVAQRGLYRYIRYRGWDHSAGIGANAQNSPATGVSADESADAVSVITGFGAAFIAIFANSPFAEGKKSEFQESRLTMWERMMGNSTVPGDLRVARFPERRFDTMARYFQWMFAGDSGIHFILNNGGRDYKGIKDQMLIVEGNPNVLTYLSQKTVRARFLSDIQAGTMNAVQMVTPDISHMETMQFAIFSGARIRYGLNHDGFPLQEFLKACQKPNRRDVEKIFSDYAQFIYIEGRDPGANFPDSELWDANAQVAQSSFIAPSAIQAGLIRNLGEAVTLLNQYAWKHLGALRDVAITSGLSGEVAGVSVKTLVTQVLEIAGRGLSSKEQWMLAYPQWVLYHGNGADRAIEFVNRHPLGNRQALIDLVRSRQVVVKP